MKKLKLRHILLLGLIILASAVADTLYGQLGESAWQPGWSGYVQMLAGGYSGNMWSHPPASPPPDNKLKRIVLMPLNWRNSMPMAYSHLFRHPSWRRNMTGICCACAKSC